MSWLARKLAEWGVTEAPLNPGGDPEGDPERVREVQTVLDELRPLLELDGGGVTLLGVTADGVRLRLTGACVGCSASAQTLQQAIEPRLRERLAWLERIEMA